MRRITENAEILANKWEAPLKGLSMVMNLKTPGNAI
jgi:hypothetical protein